ncbi:hypothetical protein ALC60_04155 [Trachymyrmex zeteki]|uniref:Uncharacterized protein n=1 Tax=Mycetomoellerius zeteki TaxID=64791 RepID=A0A151X9A6_9HYME|nr:hypothetical protein ALC60_04155 [Trachymyrmex zeteki]
MGHYELKAASSRFFSPSPFAARHGKTRPREPRPSKHPRRAPMPSLSSRNFGAPWKKVPRFELGAAKEEKEEKSSILNSAIPSSLAWMKQADELSTLRSLLTSNHPFLSHVRENDRERWAARRKRKAAHFLSSLA